MLLKLEKTLFYIFLFLIPFQIRIFLHNNGNEWNSAFLYLGDIILFLIFVLFLIRLKTRQFSIFNFQFSKTDIFLLLFVAIAAISLFATSSLGISAYRLVKLIEFVLLYIYISSELKILNPKSKILNNILSVIFYSGALQAILAIAQFIKQSSIGIKFIEAGVFSPDSLGVANFILDGEKIMRSYGSFSHPNVLAGFMLLTIFCLYKLLIENPESKVLNSKQIQNSKLKAQNPLLIIGYLLIVFALFLTFSRTAIAVFGAVSLLFFLVFLLRSRWSFGGQVRMERRKIIILFLIFAFSSMISITILAPYLKARFFTISLEEQAVDLRFFYNQIALSMIKEKPILGIGIGNFVNYSQNYQTFLRAAVRMAEAPDTAPRLGSGQSLPDWIFQPEHNVYLLIASEIGILGLIVFLGFVGMILLNWLKACFLPARHSLRHQALAGGFLVFCFLIIALVDHYFWTLQQGGIMFWLALALTVKE